MTENLSPWEQPGWYVGASAWIEEQLAHAERTVLAPPEQVRSWALSCVLRVQTSDGIVYFKASAKQPLFANEGTLLTYLATVCPGRVPSVIATDPECGWLLLEDAGSSLPGPVSSRQKAEILTTFVDVQRASIEHVERLLRSCCADRRPRMLASRIAPLLDDKLAVSGLESEEVDELRKGTSEIAEICTRLSGFSVPPTLIHGDLHAGNVLVRNGSLVYFDWAEACIAHPFMDAFMIYNEEDATVRNRMRDAYLATWADFETVERLRELWSLCGVVRAMHHAVSYWTILRHLEEGARRELAGTLPFLFREALRYLNHPA